MDLNEKNRNALCVFLLVIVLYLSVILKNEVITGGEMKFRLWLMNISSLKDVIQSNLFVDYALDDTIILHNGYYLITMKKVMDQWSVISLVNLVRMRCNFMQGEKNTYIKASSDGSKVTIQNHDLSDTVYPFYVFDVAGGRLERLNIREQKEMADIQYYDHADEYISPDKTKTLAIDKTRNRLVVKGACPAREWALQKDYCVYDDFIFIDNETIMQLCEAPRHKILSGYDRLVFYDVNSGKTQEVKIE